MNSAIRLVILTKILAIVLTLGGIAVAASWVISLL